MELTKAEKMELAATIKEMILGGNTDDEIMSTLGLSAESYSEAKRYMLDSGVADLQGLTREHHFVMYSMVQDRNIRDLDNLIGKMDSTRAHNALVGAIRLRSDISDRKMQMAFDLGVISKKPSQTEIIGGVAVVHMSADDLRKEIRGHAEATTGMMARYGEVSLMDIDPGPIHRGPAISLPAVAEDAPPEPAGPPVVRKKMLPPPAKPDAKPATKK